jgi:hypothetical protein
MEPPTFEGRKVRHAYVSVVLHKAKEDKDIVLADMEHNVATLVGIDALHNNGYISTSRSGSGFNCIALTENTGQTIDSAQTALTGELTTAGFARVRATTRTHTNGTNTSTISQVFTATGAMTNIVRSALFDVDTAPVSGVMGHIAAFATGSGTIAINDTLTVTWTITLS